MYSDHDHTPQDSADDGLTPDQLAALAAITGSPVLPQPKQHYAPGLTPEQRAALVAITGEPPPQPEYPPSQEPYPGCYTPVPMPPAYRHGRLVPPSPIEVPFWEAAVRLALPQLQDLVREHEMFGGRYYIDFALPQHKYGIELDGFEGHSSTADIARGHRRDREIQAAGWRLMHIGGAEIFRDVDGCVHQAAELIDAWKEQEMRCWSQGWDDAERTREDEAPKPAPEPEPDYDGPISAFGILADNPGPDGLKYAVITMALQMQALRHMLSRRLP